MAENTPLLTETLARLRWPLRLTWAGLMAERLVQAFWPLWSLLAACAAALMLGVQDSAMIELVWAGSVTVIMAGLGLLILGAMRLRWPRRSEALARMDAVLPGGPLTVLADRQVIGQGDTASEALWQAHQARMLAVAGQARAVEPDLRISRRDPFGLRYMALLGLVVALIFGSIWRVGSVVQMAPGGGAQLATGPTWEGWIEPPRYTGRPSLYLADQAATLRVPEGSRVTLRFYGEVGALRLAETVSGRSRDEADAALRSEQSFLIRQDGRFEINGPGGRSWSVTADSDSPPHVAFRAADAQVQFDGQMSQPFQAGDDYGVTEGRAIFRLDLDKVERRHGLAAMPDARAPIVLPLPLPVTGDRRAFTEQLIENLSDHPWAHLPVTLQLEVSDAQSQTGQSVVRDMPLAARRFFDPLAAAIVEQRRDLLWAKSNGKRVTQILRAISHGPEDAVFHSAGSYLRLRVILRRLEAAVHVGLPDAARDEIAQALWDLALQLEESTAEDALERMRAAQERLSEAMKNGASESEIARLMQDLRAATEDYLRQKSREAERGNGADQPDPGAGEGMQMTQQDLQKMMDRIEDLMEQGRMAEAEQALREFQQMMENMRVTRGEGGSGQTPGQQAMEGLSDTLREQQGLSDQAFRDLQEQFNPNGQSGQGQQGEGQSGDAGQGETQDEQPGAGKGRGDGPERGQQGQAGRDGPGGGSLADRQQALRQELENQRGGLPGDGSEADRAAREALDRAGRAMQGAEEALRQDDLAEAIDRQAQAMDALRDGMRNLGESMVDRNRDGQGGQGQARGGQGRQFSDPLGRTAGQGDQSGTEDSLLQGKDVYRRARELLDEIRRRAGENDRPEIEQDYLERLLDRF